MSIAPCHPIKRNCAIPVVNNRSLGLSSLLRYLSTAVPRSLSSFLSLIFHWGVCASVCAHTKSFVEQSVKACTVTDHQSDKSGKERHKAWPLKKGFNWSRSRQNDGWMKLHSKSIKEIEADLVVENDSYLVLTMFQYWQKEFILMIRLWILIHCQ